jgi:bifunctional NMN adenylyltransferase/nudix hydrolase
MKPYDVRVVIGRLQPAHTYHIDNLVIPAAQAGDLVVVLLGSSHKPRTFKNPLTWQMRRDIIDASVLDWCKQNGVDRRDLADVVCVPIRDYMYSDNQWIVQVQHELVKAINAYYDAPVDHRVTLHGCKKDESSYYLDYFPQWGSDLYGGERNEFGVSGTTIRNGIFDGEIDWAANVYPSARKLLMKWKESVPAKDIVEDYQFVQKYKKSWEAAPYPVIFQTVDNVIVYKGNLLLIKRGAAPGKGLWALPGGFVDYDETLLASAVRECREETKLRLKMEWLVTGDVFGRSRTIGELKIRLKEVMMLRKQLGSRLIRSKARCRTSYSRITPTSSANF